MRTVNLRLVFVLLVLVAGAARQIAQEHRPSVLRPGLRLHAYVANTGDGTLTVVDLVGLAAVATVAVGPAPSGLRAHPTHDEIWGVSTAGGYAWVLDARTNRVAAQIPVGAAPFALDFSPDGSRAYIAASGAGSVVAIDCARRQVVARVQPGRRPWIARVTPDGRTVLVADRDQATLLLLNATTLATRARIPVLPQPEHIVVLPDSSKAFVASSRTARVSAVQLEPPALLAHLPLGGSRDAGPADLVLKLDGGELYAPAPGTHGLTIFNTWTNEPADFLLLGHGPARGAITADGKSLYITDSAAGRVTPIGLDFRQVFPPIPAGRQPGIVRFTPGEDLLLVVNEGSNDLAVIRPRVRTLQTLIPVGPRPRDLAVKLF